MPYLDSEVCTPLYGPWLPFLTQAALAIPPALASWFIMQYKVVILVEKRKKTLSSQHGKSS